MSEIETVFGIAKDHEENEIFEEAKLYKDFVKEQFEEMKSPGRRFKYFWIRNALESLEKIPGQDKTTKARTLFLNYYYSLMRHWDDIADGDKEPPINFPRGKEGRVAVIENALKIVREEDSSGLDHRARDLANFCFKLGLKFDEDFKPQAEELLEHILFDAKRFGTNEVIDKKDLDNHFDKEIAGCAKATRKIFKEDEKSDEGIYPLARAVQTYYTLRDFSKDIKNGLINISEQEMKDLRLNLEDLKNVDNPRVKEWFVREAKIALNLMKKYDENIGRYNLKPLTRATLDYAFKLKAKKFLEKIVNNN